MQLEATFPPPKVTSTERVLDQARKTWKRVCSSHPFLSPPRLSLSEASLDTDLQSGLKIKFSCSTVGLWDGVTPCSPILGPPERPHVIERP